MASPQTFSSKYKIDSDANFREWGKKLSDAIVACGLVLVADTGSINWTTVTTGASKRGFEIFRFNDTLQSTAPIFIRIDYGQGSYADAAVWWTVGTGTDGSGTVTGNPSAAILCEIYNTGDATQTAYVTGSTNWLAWTLMLASPAASMPALLSIERTHDGTGADTNEGLLILNHTGAAIKQMMWFAASGSGTSESTWGVLFPGSGNSSSGSYVAVYPFFLTKGIYTFPPIGFLAGNSNNFTAGVPFSLTYYGAAHTYMPLATAGANMSLSRGANGMWLLRYE